MGEQDDESDYDERCRDDAAERARLAPPATLCP